MKRSRIIPALLLYNRGLVKSVKFKDYKYVGDPINAVKIFNEKEVDEIMILDIGATKEGRAPDIKQITEITSEAFMPLAYGGGITTLEQIKSLFFNGVEKVVLNNVVHNNPALVSEVASRFGSQSVVISIDVKKVLFKGYEVFINNGKSKTGLSPDEFAKKAEQLGAGEILLNSIERDGTYKGYDLELISLVSNTVNIPVVAVGGAATPEDFSKAINAGASAAAAGSMFVFQRPHNAVLISYTNNLK
ncbi:MAG: AglZ/HisF2 family acetamidino modification protein [Chitinophagaceae bacterium]|nr:AglZ/HisF2 family acetamidino modification protein [Chitinophagaceae bacterium]